MSGSTVLCARNAHITLYDVTTWRWVNLVNPLKTKLRHVSVQVDEDKQKKVMDAPARLRVSCLVMLQVKVTEGVSGHAADFLQRTATGPSCGKSIHVPHLRALRGCSLVSSKLLKSRKSAACQLPPPPVQKPPLLPYFPYG